MSVAEETEGTILLVEDDAPQRATLAGFLRKRGYAVHQAASAAEAEQVAAAAPPDLLLTDLRLGGPDGVSLLAGLRRNDADLQAIVLTAYGTVEDAVRAMRSGAYDFVAKPVDLDRLEALVGKALERVRLAREIRGLRETVKASGAFSELIGDSPPMSRVKDLAAKVAPSRASVLLRGESGTGKEVLARAIHRLSPRRDRPLLTVNCAALPESLVESELFGHVKGAFTGATADKPGRFALADGGTLFLDEVGDIPLPVQVKLLGVLQSGRFEPVGATASRQVDVRVVAASHRDLEQRIAEGEFRSDLYYRLDVVSIQLPPLRERPGDVRLLVDHFLRKHADLNQVRVTGVSPEVLERLETWPFAGNVRELENWIERAVVLADGPVLGAGDFPPQLFGGDRSSVPTADAGAEVKGLEQEVAELEQRRIREALQRCGGNQSAAARELGLTERAVRYKIKKYGIST